LIRRSITAAVAAFLSVTAKAAAAQEPVTDADILAIAQRHCVICHAAKPVHPALAEPPKDVVLETIEQWRAHARAIHEQTVLNRAMPIGNPVPMTEEERDKIARWFAALPRR
jgi:uncharacterized membrane protein